MKTKPLTFLLALTFLFLFSCSEKETKKEWKPSKETKKEWKPSYDCAKVTNEIEKIICDDKDLSNMDVSLSKIYKEVIVTAGDDSALIKSIKNSQAKWQKTRNECNEDFVSDDGFYEDGKKDCLWLVMVFRENQFERVRKILALGKRKILPKEYEFNVDTFGRDYKIEALDANYRGRILEYLSSQKSLRDDTHEEKERDPYDTNNSMSQDEYEKQRGEVEANNQRKARLYRAYQHAERKLACMRGRRFFPLDNCSMD